MGNAVGPDGPLVECFKAIDKPGIDGALVIRGEKMAVWGELPTIRKARVGAKRISQFLSENLHH